MRRKRRKPMCWRKTREVVPQFIYLPSLFSFPLHPPFPIRIIFHLIFLMLPEELYGSLVFLFISGLGTLPKLNTDTISGSPVAYQFLECCPPGLDQSTKITWKLWLAQPPVTLFSFFFFSVFIWILSDPMERWKWQKGFGGCDSRA